MIYENPTQEFPILTHPDSEDFRDRNVLKGDVYSRD